MYICASLSYWSRTPQFIRLMKTLLTKKLKVFTDQPEKSTSSFSFFKFIKFYKKNIK
jgi:hypothetical protein